MNLGEVHDESKFEDEEIADKPLVYVWGKPILPGPDMVSTEGSAKSKSDVGIVL